MTDFPPIANEQVLDELMSRPRPILIEFIKSVSTPLVILGAGGKMGPSLALLARRASLAAGNPLKIIAVSRFSDPVVRQNLEEQGVQTLSVDLMERSSYEELPDASNVIYLIGLKFGTTQNPGITWATNTLIPAYACERYPHSKMVALSSGNVYPLTSVQGPGSRETDVLEPLGEYSNSCVARERIFDYYSSKNGTLITLIRLYYAIDLRYGVLYDIARRVFTGEPINLVTGNFNCIWQGDANEMIIRALSLVDSPPYTLNLTGTTRFSVRQVAHEFARLMGRKAILVGVETDSALLGNTDKLTATFGEPGTPWDWVIRWTADWVMAGGRAFNKPTHFETRNGKY
jgi:nucleoside-diphosphate-sugar epimerase